jgi:hypothetical protein
VIGPAASDTPLFVATICAVPVVPGAIVGTSIVMARSAAPGPVVTVDGVALFDVTGSGVGDVLDALPPARVVLTGASLGTDSGISTVAGTPTAIGPGSVQVIGPLGSGPVHPDGSETIDTPVGGV